jgi:hypothetical protein
LARVQIASGSVRLMAEQLVSLWLAWVKVEAKALGLALAMALAKALAKAEGHCRHQTFCTFH